MKRMIFFIAICFLFTVSIKSAYSNNQAETKNLQEESMVEPKMPEIINNTADKQAKKSFLDSLPFDINGFTEMRSGIRTQLDKNESDISISEMRLQIELEKVLENSSFKLTSDFLYDNQLRESKIDIDKGKGWIDLREASITLSPFDFMDVKGGRQTLTWGTGDLIFINDLFPKDWKSFFTGRDDEYLKAPSDALKVSLYSEYANLDAVYTPRFDSDRYIDGEKISYWNPLLGKRTGRNYNLTVEKPGKIFKNDETAIRIYKNVQGYEFALYGYNGYWKSPGGIGPSSGKFTFPALNVYGLSARGKVMGGIGSCEAGYYDSTDDKDGNNPFIKNSEYRFLIGYEQELYRIAKDLTIGIQYYIEHIKNYANYKANLIGGTARDKNRHVITLRITKLLMNQNLMLSFFSYFCPSDTDAYLRPKIQYKINDYWTIEAGGNIFYGKDPDTFFGQFEKDNNVYLSLRRNF